MEKPQIMTWDGKKTDQKRRGIHTVSFHPFI